MIDHHFAVSGVGIHRDQLHPGINADHGGLVDQGHPQVGTDVRGQVQDVLHKLHFLGKIRQIVGHHPAFDAVIVGLPEIAQGWE